MSNCLFDISDTNRQYVQMEKAEPKLGQILDAALPVFARYGFHKTTMVDIARAAGISRASLYLAFNSKEEVFRAGSARAHEQTMSDVESVLSDKGDVVDRIAAAISAFQEGLIAPFSKSENARELFEINMLLAAEITTAARSKLLHLLSEALADAETQGEIDLRAVKSSPMDISAFIAAAMDGIKHSFSADGSAESALELLMRVLRLALNPHRKT